MTASPKSPRLVSVVVLLVTLILAGLTPLTATAADLSECKNGGWATLRDAAGTPFQNQGQCVSYVAMGDEFAPTGSIDLVLSTEVVPELEDTLVGVTITGSHLKPGTYVTLTWTNLDGSTVSKTPFGRPIALDGSVSIHPHEADTGLFHCNQVTNVEASAVDAYGATVSSGLKPAPC